MSVTEIQPEAADSGEPPHSGDPERAPEKKMPRWWRAWWWSVALFGTAVTSYLFTSGQMKGIITLSVICAAIVGGVVFWKFLQTWFFDTPPDEVMDRDFRYLEDVMGSAVRRPTVPFQVATILVISVIAAVASFGINSIGDLKWWLVALLGVLAVFTLVVVRNRPLFALLAVIGSIGIPLIKSWGPLYAYLWNWNILAPGLYTATFDIAIVILYIVWIRSGTFRADMGRAFSHWATWLPFVGLLTMLPSVAAAANKYTAITQLHRFVWPVLIYLYLVARVRHRSHLWAILGGFFVIIAIQIPIVIMQYKTGGVGPLEFLEVSAADREPGQATLPGTLGRPMGTFIHPAVLGSVVGAFALILCSVGASMPANKPLRYVLFLSAPMACLPIVISHTRSPFLAILVFGLVVIGIVTYRGWLSWKIVAVAFLTLFAGLGIFHEKVESTIGDQITGEKVYTELQARVRLSSVARRMTLDSPVVGIGLNNFQQENRDEQYRRENLLFIHNAHNFYLLMLSETGFLGLISTFLIGLTLFVLSYRLSRSKDIFFRGLGVGAIGFFGFLSMEAGLSFLLRMDQLNAYYWVVAGMVVASLHMDGNLRPKNAVFGGPHDPHDDDPEEIDGPSHIEPDDRSVAIGPTSLVPVTVPRRFVPVGRGSLTPRPKAPVPALMQAMRRQRVHGRHAQHGPSSRSLHRTPARSRASGRAEAISGLGARIRATFGPAHGREAVLAGSAGDGGGSIRGRGRGPGGFGRRFLRPTAVLTIILILGASQAVTAAPDLVPDGTRIVFKALDGNGVSGIYVADAGGGGIRKVTPDDGRVYSAPTWARNGNAIVYLVSGTAVGGNDIEIMAPDGSGVQSVLVGQTVQSAVMSADGRSIAFSSTAPGGRARGIYSVDLETLAVTALDAEGSANRTSVRRTGTTDRVVYTRSDPESSPDIWTHDASGGPRPLLVHKFADLMPSLSPDGSRLVVSRNEGNILAALPRALIGDLFALSGWKLLNVDPATGQTIELTEGGGCTIRSINDPCDPTQTSALLGRWSPDGDTVGFIAERSNDVTCICLVSADGSASDVLIERPDLDIRSWDWARPGPMPSNAVFDIGASAPNPEILVAGVGIDGSALRRVTPDGWRIERIDTGDLVPSWATQSGDGSKIVFSARVPYDPADAAPHPAAPAGSQRNEHFTFEDYLSLKNQAEPNAEIGEEQIFMVDANGRITQITDPWIEDWRVGVQVGDHRGNTTPSLSRDGRTLLVTNRSSVAGESFILRIDLETGTVLNLTNGTAGAQRVDDNFPDLSADGSRVAFSYTDDSGTDIHAMDAATGLGFRSISDDAFFNTMPAWSPDGQSLVYVSNRNYTEEELFDAVVYGEGEIPQDGWVLIRHELSSGAEVHLTTADRSPTLFPTWSPDGKKVAFIGGGPGVTDVVVVYADGSGEAPGIGSTPATVETSVDWA